MVRVLLVVWLASACNSPRGEPGSARSGPAEGEPVKCERLPFVDSVPVAEASGAAYVQAPGQSPYVAVVGDSGTDGAIVLLDATTGVVLGTLRLPLDSAASDDLEGLSYDNGIYYGITSSGWMRHWSRRPGGSFELVMSAYAIGSAAAGLSCQDPHKINCAKNYEGLCLQEASAQQREGCVGYVVGKRDGTLHCLERTDTGRLTVRKQGSMSVAGRGQLSGCAFGPDGRLWVGANQFGANAVFVSVGAELQPVARLGRGFPEAIAVGSGGTVYRFSDTSSSPSFANRYRCE